MKYNKGDIVDVRGGKIEILESIKIKIKTKLTKSGYTTNTKYKVKCLNCNETYDVVEQNLYKKSGCPYCCHNPLKINKSNCLATTNPELVNFLYDKNDSLKYSAQSNKKVKCVCPICGTTKEMKISNLYNKGFKCDLCSSKTSFPEKLIMSLLIELKINFKTQYKIGKYKYDFYLQEYNTILEIHGGQHYNISRDKRWKSYEEEHENDMIKYDLAILNGFEYNKNYIILDCKKSNFNYIKNNILNADFFIKLGITNDIINDAFVKCNSALYNLIINEWKTGKYLTATQLSKNINICKSKVIEILKIANELDDNINYDPIKCQLTGGYYTK